MKLKLNTDNGLQGRWSITTGYNTGLAKVAVQCSADTFVVNQTLVLRINICGENRHLRQAQKRSIQTKNFQMYWLNTYLFNPEFILSA